MLWTPHIVNETQIKGKKEEKKIFLYIFQILYVLPLVDFDKSEFYSGK